MELFVLIKVCIARWRCGETEFIVNDSRHAITFNPGALLLVLLPAVCIFHRCTFSSPADRISRGDERDSLAWMSDIVLPTAICTFSGSSVMAASVRLLLGSGADVVAADLLSRFLVCK